MTLLALLLLACTGSPLPVESPPEPPPEPPPPEWPDADVVALDLAVPDGFGTHRVFIDPGHGAPGNPGNTSSYCESEQDVMLSVAEDLRDVLEATGHFDVRLAREDEARPAYDDRIAAATAWEATVFLSLHSDWRGELGQWSPMDGLTCGFNDDSPGFSVLWSDEGEVPLVDARRGLAQAIGRRMGEAGFGAYPGTSYGTVYGADDEVAGVFVDRHIPRRRLRMLRRPTMPSVIVETHHALDRRSVRRWRDPEVRTAFAMAVAAALVDTLAARDG